MASPSLPVLEIQVICLFVAALAFQFAWLPASLAKVKSLGLKWAASNRDQTELTKLPPWGQRAERAHNNLKDNLPVFIVAALLCILLGVESTASAVYCLLFVVARVLHFVSYCLGLPWPRAISFFAGIFANIGLFVQILGSL